MTSSATSDGVAAPAGLKRGSLGTLHAIGQSLAIGPIFSAGMLTATVASVGGFNSPMAVLLAFIGSLCLAYVVSLFARRYAGAGAVYEYLARGVTNSFGIFSAGIYGLGMLLLGGSSLFVGIGYLIQGFFSTHLSMSIPYWAGAVVALAYVLFMNYRGVRLAINAVLVLCALSAIPFVLLSIVIIAKGGAAGNTLSVFSASSVGWGNVFHAVLFGVLLFVGFEASAAIAEETRQPHRSIPIAVLGTVAITGVFFLLVTYAGAVGFGEKALSGSSNAWLAAASPFGSLATRYVGSWLAWIIDLVVIIDAISCALAFVVTITRVTFALARDKFLPAPLARVSRHQTPLGSTVLVAVVAVIVIVWSGLSDYGAGMGGVTNPFAAFLIMNSAGSYLVQLIYIFLALAALGVVVRSGVNASLLWKVPVIIIGLIVPILAFKGSLWPFPSYPASISFWIPVALIAVTVAWWAFVRLKHPARVTSAASYAVLTDLGEGIAAPVTSGSTVSAAE